MDTERHIEVITQLLADADETRNASAAIGGLILALSHVLEIIEAQEKRITQIETQ